MKIASWNVNSLRVRLAHVLDWLDAHKPDALALQEIKLVDEKFPVEEVEAAGYRCVFAGQKTYNGVALLTREESRDVVRDLPGLDDPQRRVIGATVAGTRVLGLYVPNGKEVGSDKYDYKLDWLEKLDAYVAAQLEEYPDLVVVGDFNIAPEDRDIHDPEAWRGKILCSDAERAALGKLLDRGLRDTFRLFEQPDKTFSWWDYRMNGFKRNLGLRIDLVLASEALAGRCQAAEIDVEPRRRERPSDHAPVWASFGGPAHR